ncbi:C40 family peptidase [Flavobacterium agrisoli]|uniref:C40 family peptidase n=1 Tax=Flavobacterium agrisoli TaxID=2793066 RepID=A0A934PNY2_9FLAO|nr:C40 family peptidase [Flavobacterium agrisoli]MBK0370675.1 C40 family peptidase [Flavobacterium agrisoli]
MKKIIPLLLLLIGFTSCKSSSSVVTESNKSTSNSKKIISNLIRTAESNLGVKYKYAGTTKAGFYCSGLVFTTFQSESINLPRSSFEQSKIGKVIPREEAQKGDLIFFKTNGSQKINHVGLITEIEKDDIKFIHSSTSKGVIISSITEAYYKKSFEQINRIIN